MPKKFKKSAVSYICWFPSLKNGEVIWVNSLLECEFCYLCEFDLKVKKYKSQPFEIENNAYKGKLRKTIPDFLLNENIDPLLVEVKYFSQLEKEHTKQQVAIATRYAEENRIRHFLATDKFIRSGKKLFNIKLFWRYARLGLPFSLIRKCITYVSEREEGAIFQDLAFSLAGRTDCFDYSPVIYNLLFHHILQMDISSVICPTSPIWVNPDLI